MTLEGFVFFVYSTAAALFNFTTVVVGADVFVETQIKVFLDERLY